MGKRSRSNSPSLFKSICSGKGKVSKSGKKKSRSSRSKSKGGCPCKKAKGKSRSRSKSKGKKGKCHKEGIITRNPFLNFLRAFRKAHCGLTVVQIALKGAQEWNRMSDDKKLPYVRAACSAPKYKKKKKVKRLKGGKKRGRC